MITDPDQARQYLSSLSQHRDRPYDTALMHPDLALKLANAIQQARNESMPVGLLSGVREPADNPSAYDLAGDSSHEYGLAADVSGIGPAGSSTAARWRQIATQNGLFSPYDPNGSEWNHWQINPQPLEQTPQLLASLKAAKTTGDGQAMWNAYSQGAGGSNVATGPNFYDTVEQHESGGKNIQNSAGADAWGYYQFTTPTWQGVKSAHPELNLPGGSILSASHDQQLAAYKTLVQGNVAKLQVAGIPINDKNVFMASFLGAGGATQFLKAMGTNPNAAASEAFTKEAAANPTVFMEGDHPRSYAQVYALMTGKFGNGNTTGFGPNAVATAGGAGAGGGSAPAAAPAYAPPSPMQTLGQQLGQAFASMGGGGGGGAPPIQDAPDQPAIRSMAAMTDFMPSAPNPVPAQYAGGGIGSQLGALAAQPNPSMLVNPQVAPSITAGAPSMTSMLGDIGTVGSPGMFNPQAGNTLSPNPYRRIMRLA